MKTLELDYINVSKEKIDSLINRNLDKPINFIIKKLKNYFPEIDDWSYIRKLNVF